AAVLLRMARLDTLDGNAEPQPPHREPTQVEETIGRGERYAVVGTNGMGQAALLKQALKGGEGSLLFDRFHGLAEQEVTAGVIGNGKGVTIPLIPQHEFALVVCAPQSIGSGSFG